MRSSDFANNARTHATATYIEKKRGGGAVGRGKGVVQTPLKNFFENFFKCIVLFTNVKEI